MKKFKIKNRPKRKYVRKNSATVNFSASRAALFGMVPFVLFALVFFVTIILSNQALSQLTKLNLSITLPTISYEPLTQVYEKIQQSIPTITPITLPAMPKITVQIPTIDLQQPLRQLTNAVTEIIQTLQNILTTLSIICYKTINNLLSLLDPRPLFPILFNSVAVLVSTTISFVSFLVQTVIRIYIMQFTITSFLLHMALQLALATITTTQQILIHVIQAILSLVEITIRTTISFILALTHAIATGLIIVWQKIVSTTQAMLTIIETPFRIMGIYYKKVEPSLIYFFSLIKHAADEFTTTAAMIFQLPAEAAKHTTQIIK